MASGTKVAWVVGGSSGIGRAGAAALAAAGFDVVISGRDPGRLDETRALLRAEGAACESLPLDACDEQAVSKAASQVAASHGSLDVLVNSFGFNIPNRAWGDTKPADFRKLVDANLQGVFNLVDAVLPQMQGRGGGLIINIASMAGKAVFPGAGVAYTAAKHAVVALTANLNLEQGRHGVRACALCPGEVDTPLMNKRSPPPSPEALSRMLRPEDVGRTISFVAQLPPHVCLSEISMFSIRKAADPS